MSGLVLSFGMIPSMNRSNCYIRVSVSKRESLGLCRLFSCRNWSSVCLTRLSLQGTLFKVQSFQSAFFSKCDLLKFLLRLFCTFFASRRLRLKTAKLSLTQMYTHYLCWKINQLSCNQSSFRLIIRRLSLWFSTVIEESTGQSRTFESDKKNP